MTNPAERFLHVETLVEAEALIVSLTNGIAELDDRGATFGKSLVGQYADNVAKKRPTAMTRLSGKQWWWVRDLAERAAAKRAPVVRETVEIGEMKGVIRLFDKVAEHLKKPAIVLAYRVGTAEDAPVELIRLKPASATSKVPGSINVYREQDGAWLGRVLRTGKFELAFKLKAAAQEATPALTAFAADPVTGAKESAKLTGRCCFCHTALKRDESTDVGYGPICAARYGLPWGGPTGDAPKPKRTRKAKVIEVEAAPAPVATPSPAAAPVSAQGVVLDDAIYWPNGEGYTPCSKRYADLVGEQAELLSSDDRWHQIDSELHQLRATGHIGKSERFDRPDPLMALLGGATLKPTGDGNWTVNGFPNAPIEIQGTSVLTFARN